MHANDYVDAVARAYVALRPGTSIPPVRTNFVNLYKHCRGVKVQAWFRRRETASGLPELRVGVVFDLNDPGTNARRAAAFAGQFPAELRALGAEDWPGETGMD